MLLVLAVILQLRSNGRVQLDVATSGVLEVLFLFVMPPLFSRSHFFYKALKVSGSQKRSKFHCFAVS